MGLVRRCVRRASLRHPGPGVLGSWVGVRHPFQSFLIPHRVPRGFTPRSPYECRPYVKRAEQCAATGRKWRASAPVHSSPWPPPPPSPSAAAGCPQLRICACARERGAELSLREAIGPGTCFTGRRARVHSGRKCPSPKKNKRPTSLGGALNSKLQSAPRHGGARRPPSASDTRTRARVSREGGRVPRL